VRENVRFRGGHFPRWVNGTYGERGFALALEFKKVFMDEWTGELDEPALVELVRALQHALPAVVDAGIHTHQEATR
jgi:N-formylglutamate deformylase